jgi:hypothetical protein
MLSGYPLASAPIAFAGSYSPLATGILPSSIRSEFYQLYALPIGGWSLGETSLAGGINLPQHQATGGGSASGLFENITIVTLDGSASNSSEASGQLNSIAVATLNGSAFISASASGTSQTVNLSEMNGLATVSSIASGLMAESSLISQLGSAIGWASASGQSNSITIVTQQGTGSGSANTSGIIQSITIQPVAGSAFGSAVANSDMTFVAIVHQDGSAKAFFNTPGWARARVWKISPEEYRVIAIPRLKQLTIATSYVKKVNNPRAVEFARPIN